MRKRWMSRGLPLVAIALVAAACNGGGGGGGGATLTDEGGKASAITVYSGRNEELVGPLIERYEKQAGITVNVRYGGTAELAAQIVEEGANSPADVFFAQDAGALGAVAKEGRFISLPQDILDLVPAKFRSPAGSWVGISGRARVVAYNPKRTQAATLPSSIKGFTESAWKGKIGWAPTNGSFQAFVTAMRTLEGEQAAREWLEGIKANEPRVYDGNSAIVEAVSRGEVEVGFVNHYYALELKKENPGLQADNHFLAGGDPGALVNVAGVGVLTSSKAKRSAADFVEFLLSQEGQQYFASETFEYPLISAVSAPAGLPKLDELNPPDIDLSDLDDLEGTLDLLKEVGLT